MQDINFQTTNLETLKDFRQAYLDEINQPVQDHLEQGIRKASKCLYIESKNSILGYVIIGTYSIYKNHLLEFYVRPKSRNLTRHLYKTLLKKEDIRAWLINSHDRFAMSLVTSFGLEYKETANIFIWCPVTNKSDITLKVSQVHELDRLKELLVLDDFYPVEDLKYLPDKLDQQMFYSAYFGKNFIGLGFIDQLDRTPDYADIGMIVEPIHRGKGYGSDILLKLVEVCQEKDIQPVAICDNKNIASRKSLEKAGFVQTGSLLEVGIDKQVING